MNVRLLIGDDDPLMRVFVSVALGDFADTVEAANGIEVLDLLREQHFDLVLLDWDMPDCDGLAVLTTLRERECPTPIIMITAKNERGNVLQAVHSGASDYLIKPFEAASLREKVQKHLPEQCKAPTASGHVATRF